MRTVIIDNDLASIKTIENTLDDIELTKVVGKYTSTIDAEAGILKVRPDLIILEIDLSEVDGLTFAKRIEQEMNDIKFIFITPHSDYAVEAFDLNQVDFILKPFESERVKQAVNKLTGTSLNIESDVTQMICCFKNLHSVALYKDDSFTEVNLEWRTKYAKEIFTYLIIHKNENIRKDILIETIWPEADVKEAYNNLYTNIYYIRKTIKEANLPIIINNEESYYNITLNGVKVDFDFWLEKIKEYKFTELRKLERMMGFYKGHFLQEESYLWAEYIIEEYRIIWLETIEYIIQEYVKSDNIYQAVLNALYFQKLEPFLEKTYYILMDLFVQIGDLGSVEKQYKKLEKMLKEEYNTKPDKKLKYYFEKND